MTKSDIIALLTSLTPSATAVERWRALDTLLETMWNDSRTLGSLLTRDELQRIRKAQDLESLTNPTQAAANAPAPKKSTGYKEPTFSPSYRGHGYCQGCKKKIQKHEDGQPMFYHMVEEGKPWLLWHATEECISKAKQAASMRINERYQTWLEETSNGVKAIAAIGMTVLENTTKDGAK